MLDFERHGALRLDRAAFPLLDVLEAVCASLPGEKAGVRLYGVPGLEPVLGSEGLVGQIAGRHLRRRARPVRATLFNKSAEVNWTLGWHQDRTIAVRKRYDLPGFGPWTIKGGVPHVEPPFALIEQMLTIRIHLDPVAADNAPLMIAPGSQRLGRIVERDIEKTVRTLGTATCLAARGDAWIYATSILHASAAGLGTSRRVLQVDYSANALPAGLDWAGI